MHLDNYSGKIFTFGTNVATEPFPDMSVKLQSHGDGAVKAMRIENRVAGVWLKVVFPSQSGLLPGMKVMVSGRLYQMQWAKEIQEYDDKKFIFVPEKDILAVDGRG